MYCTHALPTNPLALQFQKSLFEDLCQSNTLLRLSPDEKFDYLWKNVRPLLSFFFNGRATVYFLRCGQGRPTSTCRVDLPFSGIKSLCVLSVRSVIILLPASPLALAMHAGKQQNCSDRVEMKAKHPSLMKGSYFVAP